jgi:hypothetical protein
VRIAKYRALLDAQKTGRVRTIGVSNLCVHSPLGYAVELSISSDVKHLEEIRAVGLEMPAVNHIEVRELPRILYLHFLSRPSRRPSITSSFRTRVTPVLACVFLSLFPPVSTRTRLSLNSAHLHCVLRYMFMLRELHTDANATRSCTLSTSSGLSSNTAGSTALWSRPSVRSSAARWTSLRSSTSRKRRILSLFRLTPQKTNSLCSTTASLRRCSSAGRSKRGTCPSPRAMRRLTDSTFSFIPLPKSATPARIRSNADVFGFELAPEDMAALDALDQGKAGSCSWNPVDAD